MKIILFANTDWYLYNFRFDLAQALKERGDEVVMVSPPGEYVEKIRQAGFRHVEIPLTRRGMNPLVELGAIRALAGLYRRERPDLVHHFTVKCVLYGSLAARLCGLKGVVNSVTGLGYIFLPGGWMKRVLRFFILIWYRLVFRQSQAIFENDDDRQTFLRYGLIAPGNAHLVSGVGVDVERFAPTTEPPGAPVAVLASRMLWDKGVGEFVAAARILREESLAGRFALCGRVDSGNPASIAQEQIDAWQNSGDVEWWGWSDDMPELFRKVHIVCLPSYREGLPTVLMEAASCGKPVVATDVPGCRDAVIDNETGLLVPARDAQALADALRALMADPALRSRMGQAGRDFALRTFSSKNAISKILAAYQAALQF